MPDKKEKTKNQSKVRDMKPKKDAKGGSFQWGTPRPDPTAVERPRPQSGGGGRPTES